MPTPFQVISNPSPPSTSRPRASVRAGQVELQLMGALMASSPPFSPTMTPAARASMEKAIRWHQRQGGLHHGALMEFLL
jgi:hypothetical protein